MATITNGKYANFSNEVNDFIQKAYHIYVNIANDPAGENPAIDSNGHQIVKKLLTGTNYTYPNQDAATGHYNLGNIKISFSDGSFFTVNDDNTSYWYLLEYSEPYVFKPLV
jgi:hypothetical protein